MKRIRGIIHYGNSLWDQVSRDISNKADVSIYFYLDDELYTEIDMSVELVYIRHVKEIINLSWIE